MGLCEGSGGFGLWLCIRVEAGLRVKDVAVVLPGFAKGCQLEQKGWAIRSLGVGSRLSVVWARLSFRVEGYGGLAMAAVSLIVL